MAIYDINAFKESLTVEQVKTFMEYLGAEPTKTKDGLICKTVCHKGDSHKLYYYNNNKLFQCYTNCGSMDIIELYKRQDGNEDKPFLQILQELLDFFGLEEMPYRQEDSQSSATEKDEDIFLEYDKLKTIDGFKKIRYNIYDDKIIDNLQFVLPVNWLQEGIDIDTMRKYNIRYYGTDHKIVIPHYNINGELIGIRGRALSSQDAELYGKYMPLRINNILYTHPLSQNLYGLHFNLDNINKLNKIILFEGEKSVMLYESLFGAENNVSVATCGSSLSLLQEEIIKQYCDVDEIIIAYDKEFTEFGSDEFHRHIDLYMRIAKRLSNFATVSVLFDKDKDNQLLDYKDAPIDKGKEVFEQLFAKRIIL